jgi:glycosyltransferase involved in cell wall biosynthesis
VRVVILNPAGVIGGGERVLLATVRAVRDHLPAAEPTVVLLADGPLRAAAELAGARVEVLPLPPALAGLGDTQLRGEGKPSKLLGLGRTAAGSALPTFDFVRRFRTLLRRLRPDVVHSNGLKTHLLARVGVPAGVPITWHLHDFYSERPLMAKLLKRVRRGVVGGVAISEAVKRDFEAVVTGVPAWVVRNGVDTGHFTPPQRAAGLTPAGSESAGVNPAAPAVSGEPSVVRVGLVATFANWKGHDVFLQALAKLPRELPVRGYVVGGPIYTTAGSQWTLKELEQRADRLGIAGRVEFVPFQHDPAGVYRSLDVVVHASTRPEPFGLTIAEAMSCERAVVVSAAGGAAELFREGVDALGHPPGDVEKLAEVIERLVTDAELRTRLGRAARETAVRSFGADRFGREIAGVFHRVRGR